MSKFIELSDYDASIHRDILDALTRNDDAIVEICEDRAIAEMRGYLSGHYDCDKLFAATGDERNQLVLMMALDIAIYHISPSIIRRNYHRCGKTDMTGRWNG